VKISSSHLPGELIFAKEADFMRIRRFIFLFLLSMAVLGTASCSKKTGCPTYDQKSGKYKAKSGKKVKEKGLFPKKMRR